VKIDVVRRYEIELSDADYRVIKTLDYDLTSLMEIITIMSDVGDYQNIDYVTGVDHYEDRVTSRWQEGEELRSEVDTVLYTVKDYTIRPLKIEVTA